MGFPGSLKVLLRGFFTPTNILVGVFKVIDYFLVLRHLLRNAKAGIERGRARARARERNADASVSLVLYKVNCTYTTSRLRLIA